MRLMQKDLVAVDVYGKKESPSGYVATKKATYERIGFIYAVVKPVRDSGSVALYGDRISKMYSLALSKETALTHADSVAIDGDICKVVELLRYSDHCEATVEKTGVRV